MLDDELTTKQVADQAGVTVQGVHYWINTGKIRAEDVIRLSDRVLRIKARALPGLCKRAAVLQEAYQRTNDVFQLAIERGDIHEIRALKDALGHIEKYWRDPASVDFQTVLRMLTAVTTDKPYVYHPRLSKVITDLGEAFPCN